LAAERKALRSRIQALTKRIRDVKQDPARDQHFEDTLQQLLREKAAMNEIVRSMNERQVLNFFTDEGLLPNYAFPEAGVILRSVIYRRNPKAEDDERKYKTRTYEYERPASAAILELAPANHFYAEGRKLQVDQVNLQVSQIEAWRFCTDCSYLELEGRSEPRALAATIRFGPMKGSGVICCECGKSFRRPRSRRAAPTTRATTASRSSIKRTCSW
jgi:DEAD/DEAH box helicase domain-containing protein